MKPVALAAAEDPRALAAELTADTRIGRAMGLDIHILHGWEKPVCMAEIGRIREQAFRAVGAGRNLGRDVDHLDLTPGSYRQLVTWDPANKELVSMYRFADTAQLIRDFGLHGLRTHSLFEFSTAFQNRYLARSIELGRSVVNRQARRSVVGLFAAWRGLGILVREHPGIDFFFGTVTLPESMPPESLDALVHFLNHHYSSPDLRQMVRARGGLQYRLSSPSPWPCAAPIDSAPCGKTTALNSSQAHAALIAFFAKRGETVPPILLSYLRATHELQVFDTAKEADFGDAWQTALAVPIAGLNVKSKQRFLDGYIRAAGGYFDS